MECLTVPDIRLTTLLACGVILAAAPAVADEASEFYAGRNVTIVIGYGAGGGGGADTYGRFLAQHLGDFIPGKPNVIV